MDRRVTRSFSFICDENIVTHRPRKGEFAKPAYRFDSIALCALTRICIPHLLQPAWLLAAIR